MEFTLPHENGEIWEPVRRTVDGTLVYVLSNGNALGHEDPKTGKKEKSNKSKFQIFCSDERSVLNCLQMGCKIRMTGIGNNLDIQQNLFNADEILVDGKPIHDVVPGYSTRWLR